ncbi:hypothetical protein [Horticoccus sp. 23ND18S-11]|uniref:hypothetical protein n=1 Tax=Horticoccus sp. 23ND18S-11 TaxID=3391832 RepID=UPI0039C941AC
MKIRPFAFLLWLGTLASLQAQEATGGWLPDEQKSFVAGLDDILTHVGADFAPLKAGEVYEGGNTKSWQSSTLLFPASDDVPSAGEKRPIKETHSFVTGRTVVEFQEGLPGSMAEFVRFLESQLATRGFVEVAPIGFNRTYRTRAYRSEQAVVEVVSIPSGQGLQYVVISRKKEYFASNVAVIGELIQAGGQTQNTLPFEVRKQIGASLARILADAGNQFKGVIADAVLKQTETVTSHKSNVELFPADAASGADTSVSYHRGSGPGAIFTTKSPYRFDQLGAALADMLLGMGYDEVKPMGLKAGAVGRVFRGPQAVVELIDPRIDGARSDVAISRKPDYFAPDATIVAAGKNSPSSPAVPLDFRDPVSPYPSFEKKYAKGPHIDGKLIGGKYYVGNIYTYTDFFGMRPSRFTGVYQVVDDYWKVEEVKGTVHWDYLGVSFTGDFMPYDIYKSKLWAKGHFKKGNAITPGYLYHYTSEPYVWFVPDDTRKSRIDLAYTAGGKPYLRDVRAEQVADAKAWAEAEARLKRLPEGYYRSDYKGPAYDGNGRLLTASTAGKSSGAGPCSDCNGKGWIEQVCGACNNTRMSTATVYDTVTVSGPFGRTNVSYSVGQGRPQSTWCGSCVGVVITSSQYRARMESLGPKKCTRCKGTGKLGL